VIFGDSISDTGNVLSLTTAFAPPPFPSFPGAAGRFSNGPAWTEYLAAGLGLPGNANPSNLLFTGAAVVPIGPQGGQNFAYGGARTGLGGSAGPTTGLVGQLINWNGSAFASSLTRAADPGALYVVLAGANDLRDYRSGAAGAITPVQVATNVTNAVGLLAQAGARHFLVSNLPDLGKTPEAVALGKVPESTAVTLAFNAALSASMTGLDALFLTNYGVDLDIRSMDFYGMFESVYSDAVNNGGAVFGITNVAAPCIAPVSPGAYFYPGSTDINCSVSAFSDPLHPSAASHQLLGQLALQAVPEPGSVVLMAIGLAALGLLFRKQAS
jgi:phospholipase/lecithinase/hemolysin